MGGDAALKRAAVLAMRDAAALIIMQMDKATNISRIGNQSLSSIAAGPEPAASEPAAPEPVNEEDQTTASEELTDETG
jgi:hypothetical protein